MIHTRLKPSTKFGLAQPRSLLPPLHSCFPLLWSWVLVLHRLLRISFRLSSSIGPDYTVVCSLHYPSHAAFLTNIRSTSDSACQRKPTHNILASVSAVPQSKRWDRSYGAAVDMERSQNVAFWSRVKGFRALVDLG